MKRRTLYVAVLIAIAALWLGLKLKFKGHENNKLVFLIDVFPWFLLMAFGSYCVTKLGYDMLTFNDYPEEIKVLEKVNSKSYRLLFLLQNIFSFS